jgi:MoaA/NifB/PqqE/SkfB family radical SAM enzyme
MVGFEHTPARASARQTIPVRSVAPDEGRWSACYAPHTSMYFDQFGKVRACCQNTGVHLGDVTVQSLEGVWTSASADRLRSALEADDYSAGCEFCEWQLREGNEAILFARQYDEHPPSERRPPWPRLMEFSVTNTCNLACIMCNGDWSSTIRSKREGRPPLEAVYGERFFAELAPFLPHLDEVRFLGGEPFLGREPLRIMEMIAGLDRLPRVTITTNATIRTARVERIVELLRPHVVVSLDGASPATYDAIRLGARFDEVVANLDWFRKVLGPERVSITHCLMTANWHEFADLLTLAEDRKMHVGVNVVRFPEALSLYHLQPDQLEGVVRGLRATDVSNLTDRRRDLWEGHLGALGHRLETIRSDDGTLGRHHGLPGTIVNEFSPWADWQRPANLSRWPWLPFPELDHSDPGPEPSDHTRPAIKILIGTDAVLRVTRHDPLPELELHHLDGKTMVAFVDWMAATFGPESGWSYAPRVGGVDDNRFLLHVTSAATGAVVRIRCAARRNDLGELIGGRLTIDLPADDPPCEHSAP